MGRGTRRSLAKGGVRSLRTGEPQPGDAGTLKLRVDPSRRKRSAGKRAEAQEGRGPSSLRGHCDRRAPGRAHPHRGPRSGLQRAGRGLGRSRWVRRGLGGYRRGCCACPFRSCGSGSSIPAAQAPDPRALRGHSPHPEVPPGRQRQRQ